MTTTTTVAIPLFPQFTALDGIGPYEVLQRIPDFDVTFIGHERGVVRSDNGMLGIEIDAGRRRRILKQFIQFCKKSWLGRIMPDG